jgi:hypothetical protein
LDAIILTVTGAKTIMANDQDELRKEYGQIAGRRAKFQQCVNQEQTKWNGRGEKPAALLEAERHRDDADIELAKVADKIKP